MYIYKTQYTDILAKLSERIFLGILYFGGENG